MKHKINDNNINLPTIVLQNNMLTFSNVVFYN